MRAPYANQPQACRGSYRVPCGAPQVAIAVVNTSNRLARGRMTEDKVDRRHSIWVLAEGTWLATEP